MRQGPLQQNASRTHDFPRASFRWVERNDDAAFRSRHRLACDGSVLRHRHGPRGLTLIEVLVSMTVLIMLTVGIFGGLIQSRRITEGSIYQNSALTIVQGYLEQIKNMEFSSLPYRLSDGTLMAGAGSISDEIPTLSDQNTADPLRISSGAPLTPASIVPGSAAPSGVIDNVKSIDINQTSGNTADNLQLRLWVWIQDVSDATIDATQVRAITLIYQFRIGDGGRGRWVVGSVRNIRSSVPTF